MTVVNVDLRKPAADGTDVPDAKGGYLECSPTARRKVDQHLTLPAAFDQSLVDGKATLDLAPTVDGTWAWNITERAVGPGIKRLVAVPADGPVSYADLLDVDPETLDPSTPVAPAYKALIDAAKETADEAKAEAVSAGDLALAAQSTADAAVPAADLPSALATEISTTGTPAEMAVTAKIAAAGIDGGQP